MANKQNKVIQMRIGARTPDYMKRWVENQGDEINEVLKLLIDVCIDKYGEGRVMDKAIFSRINLERMRAQGVVGADNFVNEANLEPLNKIRGEEDATSQVMEVTDEKSEVNNTQQENKEEVEQEEVNLQKIEKEVVQKQEPKKEKAKSKEAKSKNEQVEDEEGKKETKPKAKKPKPVTLSMNMNGSL